MAARLAERLSVAPDARDAFIRFARGGPDVDEVSFPHFPSSAPTTIKDAPPFAEEKGNLGHRTNLPLQVTSFVGRGAELVEVRERLDSTRLLTLTGTGGVGKTRLAQHVGTDLVDVFADGVWFIDLGPLNDPLLVPQAVARVLNIRETPACPMLTTLVEALRYRHLLLLMDNCEHLIDACARLIDVVLQTCVQVSILATSREMLDVRGEVIWRVPSLALPAFESGPLLEELQKNEAIRLFVDRALAVFPGFEATQENATVLAKVCQRLDGIPLAIELAAARTRVLTVDQIASRLDDRFRLLTGGSRTALPRQQTLRALIDWSHDLLSNEERLLFRRLAVFAGSWTLEAAEAVCAGSGIKGDALLDQLTGLVNKSLVVFESRSREGRYRFLETIHAYAREKLFEAGEDGLLREKHRDWCIALVERAEPHLLGRDTPVWCDLLVADDANVRAALEWCLETDPDGGLRLGGSLWKFWYLHDGVEGHRWLTAILARAPEGSPACGRALLGAGFCARHVELSQAQSWTEQSLAIARATGDDWLAGWALHNLGVIALMTRNHASARRLLEESVAVCGQVGDKAGEELSLRDLGRLARTEADYERAAALYEQSLEIARAMGHRWNILPTLLEIGYLARQQQDPQRARAAFQECLSIGREDRVHAALYFTARAIGELERSVGSFAEAEAYFKEAMVELKKAGRIYPPHDWLYSFGTLLLQRGSYGRGVRLSATVAVDKLIPVDNLPDDVADHDTALQTARAVLGDAAFTSAWAEGHAMTLEQAIEYALEGNGT